MRRRPPRAPKGSDPPLAACKEWHRVHMVTRKWWAGAQAPAASEPRGPAHELELDFRPATLAALRPSVLFRCRPAMPCSAVPYHELGAAVRVTT